MINGAVGALIGAAGAPSSHVSLRVLFTFFQTDVMTLLADSLLFLSAGLYLIGMRRLQRRGRHWPRSQMTCFLVALLLVFIAIGSGLAAYDENNLSAHVVQHLLLMMIAAPLFALGRPVTLLAQASSRRTQVSVLRAVNSRIIQVLSGPLSWALYYCSMWVYFVTPIYAYSIAEGHSLFHYGTHVWFMTIGYLFWQGVIGLDVSHHRLSPAARLGGLLIGMPLEAFLGLTVMSMAKPIAPGYSVSGTHAGGAVFWITSMLIMAVAILLALRQWMESEDRRAARLDAVLDRQEEIDRDHSMKDAIERCGSGPQNDGHVHTGNDRSAFRQPSESETHQDGPAATVSRLAHQTPDRSPCEPWSPKK